MDDADADADAGSAGGSLTPTPPSSPPLAAIPVSAPPGQLLTLALPIQNSHSSRDDAWSEGATSALIDAWGERFVALGRGSLRHPQWQEVADVVSSRDGYSKPPKSDVQCKNRIDTLKKKYKNEKSKSHSSWAFFDRLDELLGPVYKQGGGSGGGSGGGGSSSDKAAPTKMLFRGVPLRPPFPQRLRTPTVSGSKRPRLPSPPPRPEVSASSESSDGFPPEPVSQPVAAPAVAMNGKGEPKRSPTGLNELAAAIRRLGEAYERVERSKMEAAADAERQRMEFAREIEKQRMQFFVTAQMELSQARMGSSRSSLVESREEVVAKVTQEDGVAGTSAGPAAKFAYQFENNVGGGASEGVDGGDEEEDSECDDNDEEEESQ